MNKEINNNYPEAGEENFIRRNISRLKMISITLFAGVLLGVQIYNPNKRVIEGIVGAVILFLLWQVSTLPALWFILLSYPFPFAISWGNSNFVFMLIIVIMLLLRVSSGEEEFKLDRTLLLPFVMLTFSYIFSFNNVPLGTRIMNIGLVNTGNFLAAGGFAFIFINFIKDEEMLIKAVNFLIGTISLVILFNVVEILFPNRVLIPGWLHTRHEVGVVMKGIRVKGPFRDFELNAEFFTLHSFIIFFMIIRTKRLLSRSLLTILLVADLFMMFATITRGAFFSLIAGVMYLTFLSRKDLNIVKLSIFAAIFVLLIVGLEGFVAEFTVSGSLFDRVVQTTFNKGFIPDTRTGIWEQAIERGMQHPVFGNGPGWDFASGFSKGFWPHNLYLFYFNSLGLVGLISFLFLMFRLVKATLPGIKASLVNSPFSEAFMKIMHVVMLVFLLDQLKIEYLRNHIYTYTIWILFAFVLATKNVINNKAVESEVVKT